MTVTDDEHRFLEEFFELHRDFGDEIRSSPREQSFIADQRERFEKYGQAIALSPAQWDWLRGIRARLNAKAGCE